jgi:hypothetical protein
MSNTYVLVNPYVQGEFKTNIKSNNSIEAGRIFYKGLSEHFNNAVPKFYFTVQKGESGKGKLYHFQVKEIRKKDNVSFSLAPYDIVGGGDIDLFKGKLTKIKDKFTQDGGKNTNKKNTNKKNSKKSTKSKKEDSDSDSDSSDDYKRINKYVPILDQPFYYWWYDPVLYNLNSYYIPTFYQYNPLVIEYSYL